MSRTIAGYYNTGIGLTDTGDNPVSVTGTIDVASGYAIGGSGGNGESWTIDNSGLLRTADTSVINLGSLAGNVTNGVVINETGGTIAGGGYGVSILGPGAVTNNAGATISAGGFQGVFIYGAGSVDNSGVINAGNIGVYLAAGGSVSNRAGGSIYGAGGVWLQQAGTVANAGTITGTNAGFGAVKFEGYTAYNRLVVTPGAVFDGNVAGGGGVLELAQGSGAAGTLYGLGTTITNFSTVQFDAGAAWTVAGDTAGLTGTIVGFDPLVTIDVTGFAAVSETFAYNQLTLSNGAGSYAVLPILGNFSTSDFNVASDGNGGAVITEALTAGTYDWIGPSGDWTTQADWNQGAVPGIGNSATIANPGSNTVTIGAGESVAVADVFLGADTLEIDGTLAASGTLTISGGVVSLTPTGLVEGGTIADPAGTGFAFQGGTFDGVTYLGPIEIAADASTLFVTNGLTVTDPSGTMPGTIDLTQGGDARVAFVNSQNFDNATINLNGADASNPLTGVDIGGADHATLTLGPNATVDSTTPSAQAEIGSTGTALTAVLNLGTISAEASGGNFTIDPQEGFTNNGTILVGNGDALSIQPISGTFDNAGYVAVDPSSTLRIAAAAAAPSVSNTGTIDLAAGATLDLAGWFNLPSLGTLINQGAVTRIDGTFDGQGGTLALGDGTELGTVILGSDISNATVAANDALSIVSGNASLLNDVYQGPIDLTAGAATLTIHEAVTETDATGLLAGSIDVTGSQDTLAFNNLLAAGSAGQTLDNVTVAAGNAQAADSIQASFNGGTFTIGSHAAIVSTSTAALANLTAAPGTTLVLDGTLTATGTGGTFTVASASTFINDGQMQVSNGDTLSVTTPVAAGGGNGTTEIGTGGVADFTTGVAADQTVVFADATGVLRLQEPGAFAASLSGFTIGDTIDLAGTPATSVAWTPGTLGGPGELAIGNAGSAVGTLTVLGDYSADSFAVASDGAGGSIVSLGTRAPLLPPVIGGVPANQVLPLQTQGSLFATVRVTDADIANIDTATVTLSSPSAGALTNLDGGSYDAAAGVYTVTGTPAAITSAIDGLSFVPSATASSVVSTVTFSISAAGPGGSASPAVTSLTQLLQLLSLAGVPTGQVTISAPPDGSSFASMVPGQTNEALVTNPTSGGSYALPTGYQAAFLGGTADATLTDATVGNALLVGNSGNDTIVAAAGHDTLMGGSGTDILSASGTGDVIHSGGSATENASGSNDTVLGNADTLTATDSGTDDKFGLGSGVANMTLSGVGAQVYANTGTANIVDSGTDDAIGGFTGDMAITVAGSGARVFGSAGQLDVAVASTASGAAIGAGSGPAMISIAGSGATVFGSSGNLSVDATGTAAVIGAGLGASGITIAGSGATVFGGSGNLSLNVTGNRALIGIGSGAAAVTVSGDDATVFGSSGSLNVDATGTAAVIGAGLGASMITIAGSGATVFGGSGNLSLGITGNQALIGIGPGAAAVTVSGNDATIYGGTGTLSADVTASANRVAIGLDSGPASMTLAGSAACIYGGSGPLTVLDSGTGDTISAGSGVANVTANGNDVVMAGGSGTLQFVGGAGSATVFGGSGQTSVTGGAGATALFGNAGGVITFIGSIGAAIYQAGLGNETLNASASLTPNVINGGIDPGGSDSLVGGSGNDSLGAGSGADTFTGGAGNNEFVFYRNVIAGSAPSDVITDFNASDSVILAGYGATAASDALATATTGNGNTTITLADSTRITFLDVFSPSGLQGHVFSG